MFTGLVAAVGRVIASHGEGAGRRLTVTAALVADAEIGESVCVGGCCLSVVARDGDTVEFQLGPETLARTTLAALGPGSRVNLERSLRLSDRLGGHLVTGHVDGVGRLATRQVDGEWVTCRFAAPPELARQLAAKGSVAVDGVSLTVVEAGSDFFTVALIPHTLAETTLGDLAVGDAVNLETDLVCKYVARLLAGGSAPAEWTAGGAP
ncbi:MAG: riboflavin synthase [Planctomycetota bacterium]|nr:riboflavin synthase [Planctomycetota bacterium]